MRHRRRTAANSPRPEPPRSAVDFRALTPLASVIIFQNVGGDQGPIARCGLNTMKTQSSITQIILRLLLVTSTLMLAPCSARAGDGIPFKGEVNGTTVGIAPDPGGVVLTLQGSGCATHLGRSFREEVLVFNPLTGTLNGTMVFTAAKWRSTLCYGCWRVHFADHSGGHVHLYWWHRTFLE